MYILFVHYVSSKPKDQYIRDKGRFSMMTTLDLEAGGQRSNMTLAKDSQAMISLLVVFTSGIPRSNKGDIRGFSHENDPN